jgi:hypothetical protein
MSKEEMAKEEKIWDDAIDTFKETYQFTGNMPNCNKLIDILKKKYFNNIPKECFIVVWKDGSYKFVEGVTWEYEDDETWLTTIKLSHKENWRKKRVNNVKDKWDSIYEEFKGSDNYRHCLAANLFPTFWKWLSENYSAPKKIL